MTKQHNTLENKMKELNTPFTREWMDYKVPLSHLDTPIYESNIKRLVNATIGKDCSNQDFLDHVAQLTIAFIKENESQFKYNAMIYIAISAVLRDAYATFYKDGSKRSDFLGVVRKEREKWLNENFSAEIARHTLRTAIRSTISVKFHNDLGNKKMMEILIPAVEDVLADTQPSEIRQNVISNAISQAVKDLFTEDSGIGKFLLSRERI